MTLLTLLLLQAEILFERDEDDMWEKIIVTVLVSVLTELAKEIISKNESMKG
jgi:hypothetical protein